MINNREEARLAEKLTKTYNAHCVANTIMTLATVQTEVKKFWRDRKETRDLMYKGPNKSVGNSNNSGQGQNITEKNKSRKQRKKDKKKSGSKETVAQVTSNGEKEKEKYCFRCGETSHRIKECPKKGDLKCKAHPNSTSHNELACFYYRKANSFPIWTRPRQDGSKDS